MALGGLKKKRRIQLVFVAFGFLLAAFGLVYFALGDGVQYYRGPTQVLANPPKAREVFRIGGLVKEGSIVRGEGKVISFAVTDRTSDVAVNYVGILPDLFKEGQGMIATGSYANNVFQATVILAKHDEEYMPKEVTDILKEQGIYKAPNGE